MKKLLFITFLIVTLISCKENNSKDKTIQEQQARIAELEAQQKTSEQAIDSASVSPPPSRRTNRKMHFPEGMFETYPQIINFLFAIGSTSDEVLNILGKPEYVESKQEKIPNTGNYYTLETWYYGKMEIELRTGVVNNISHYGNNKHCFYYYGIEMADLYISDNPIEKKWALHLMDNTINSKEKEFADGINRAIR